MVYTINMQSTNSGKYYGAAAQYNKSSGLGFGGLLKIAGLVVGILVLITLGYFGYSALTSAGRNAAAQLVAREKQLLSFVATNQSALSSDDLKTVASNSISLFTSDGYSLLQVLKGFGLSAVPDIIAKAEVDSTSAKTLATAKIQSQFDKVFVQLLRDKIAAEQSLARTVLDSANSNSKTLVQTHLSNLTTIDEQLVKLRL
jgi:hypothetical protein